MTVDTTGQYGVTIGFNIGNNNTLYAYWSNLFADLNTLGCTWIRLNYSWKNIERTQGVYTYTVLDDAVTNINNSTASDGKPFRLLFCIRDAPTWALTTASQKATSEPWYLPDPTLMAGFATAVLSRYNGGAQGHIDAIGYNEDFNIHHTPSTDTFTLNANITHAGGPYTTLTITPALQTADTNSLIYLGGYNNTTDVATISSPVAVGDTLVHINSFTPAVSYNTGATLNVAYIALSNSPYSLYNPGTAGVRSSLKSNPARDAHFAAAVHNALQPAVRAINPTMPLGLPLMWWTQPKNNNTYPGSPSNYTAFMTTLYQQCNSIDAHTFIDFHYYSNSTDPSVGSPQTSTITQAVADLQAVSATFNDAGRSIWLTEFGWQVPVDCSEPQQSTNYSTVMNAIIPSKNPNGNKAFFFTLFYQTTGGTGSSLIYWNGTGYSYRQAFTTLKNFILAHPNPIASTIPISVNPTSLTFTGTVGGSNPANQAITVSNGTTSAEPYTATVQSNASWLTVSPTSGILAASGSATSTLSVSLTGLAIGTYVGTVTYQSGFNSAILTVTLVVNASGGIGGGGGQAPTPPYSVLINGTSYFIQAGTLAIDSAIGRRSTAYATVHTQNTSTHFQQDQQVSIVGANGVPIFSGYISLPRETKPGFQSSLDHQLQFVDQHRLADKRIMAKAYTNKPASFIVQDIVNTYLSAEGVTVGQIYDGPLPSTTLFPSTTLYPNGSDSYIPNAVFAYAQVSQALDELVKNTTTGGIPYYWQIDQNKKLWFVPYTAIQNSTVVDGTLIDEGILSGLKPTVIRANPAYRNGQYITGGVQTTVPQTKIIYGDGQTSAWALDFPVNSLQAFYVNGTLKTKGIKGVDSGKDFYYAVGDPIVVQDASATKLVGGQTASTNSVVPDVLTVFYVGQYPSVFYSQNAAQVAFEQGIDGTSGIVEEVESDTTIISGSTGLARVANLLQRYGIQGQQFKFNTLVSSYQPGQMITVNYAPHGFVNTQMLIEQVTASDQHDGLNFWNTVYAIAGPYDTTWVAFFSNLIQQAKEATANINVGIASGLVVLANFTTSITVSATMTVKVFQVPVPSPTLFPSTTLYPG